MVQKIILFNGPPSSGKDTLANHSVSHYPKSEIVKFAAPLKIVATHLYCGGNTQEFYQHDTAENKNKPSDVFFGKSCREVQIAISEQYAKPVHGQDVFGKILAVNIAKSNNEVFFVSDSGFRPEAEVLVNKFGAENVLLIRIHREGFDFTLPGGKRDSRGYINLDDLQVETHDLDNINGDINNLVAEAGQIIGVFTGRIKG